MQKYTGHSEAWGSFVHDIIRRLKKYFWGKDVILC
jgi:hypothetical protein